MTFLGKHGNAFIISHKISRDCSVSGARSFRDFITVALNTSHPMAKTHLVWQGHQITRKGLSVDSQLTELSFMLSRSLPGPFVDGDGCHKAKIVAVQRSDEFAQFRSASLETFRV